MKRNLKHLGIALGSAGVVAAAFVGGRAWAGGIPATGALNYSGLLEDATGAPLTTAGHNLEIKLWSTGPTGGTAICDTSVPTLALVNGRFSVPLDQTCTPAIGANPGAYVEVLLDGSSLGRTQLGAVPYAVEANHAVNADHVAIITAWTADPNVKLFGYGDQAPANNQTTASSWRRVGDTAEVQITTTVSAPPTTGQGALAWSLPTGVALDQTKMDRVKNGPLGYAYVDLNSGAAQTCTVSLTGNLVDLLVYCDSGQYLTAGSLVAGQVLIHMSLPVAGWAN